MITRVLFFVIAFVGEIFSQSDVLNGLVEEALQKNPQLHGLRHLADAAKAKIGQVRTLDAPQVSLEFFEPPVTSFPLPFRKNMETDYAIQQMFPWPGKLSSMKKAAEFGAKMRAEDISSYQIRLIRDIKITYYELGLIQEQLRINSEKQNLLTRILDAVKLRYEFGQSSQSEILKIKTDISKTTNEQLELELQFHVMETMLNTLLSRPADSSIGKINLPEPNISEKNYDELIGIASTSRPEIKSMESEKAMYSAELQAAKREFFPDIMVRGMYKSMVDRRDAWALMIGANIPLAFWSSEKYRAKVRESQSHENHSEMEITGMQNMIGESIQSALTKNKTGHRQIKLFKEELLPQADQNLQVALSEYQTGKTTFIMLLDAYQMLLMTKTDYAMVVMNTLKSEAELEYATGSGLKHAHGIHKSVKEE